MELQQLRYVIAVARERNFTRAAHACHVVQSALSHQIKVLERELGVELFARTSRKVELTEAGEAFVAEAQATLEAADRAVMAAAATTGEVRGTLRLGVIPTVTSVNIATALGEFHRLHPEARMRLSVGDSNQFIAALRAGELDVAILGLPGATSPENVAVRALARQELVAVLSTAHPLAGASIIQLRDLAGETFVDFPSGSPGRAQSDLAFAAAGLTRTVAFEVMSAELMLDLVGQGLAVSLLSAAVVPAGRSLVTVEVADGPSRTELLAWSDFNPSPAAKAFLEIVTDHTVSPDQGV